MVSPSWAGAEHCSDTSRSDSSAGNVKKSEKISRSALFQRRKQQRRSSTRLSRARKVRKTSHDSSFLLSEPAITIASDSHGQSEQEQTSGSKEPSPESDPTSSPESDPTSAVCRKRRRRFLATPPNAARQVPDSSASDDSDVRSSNASILKASTLALLEWDEQISLNGKILSEGLVLDTAVEHKELLSVLNQQNPRGKHLLKCQTTHKDAATGKVILMRVECAHTRVRMQARRRTPEIPTLCLVCGFQVPDSKALLEHQREHSTSDLKLSEQRNGPSSVTPETKKPVKIRSKRVDCPMFILFVRGLHGGWTVQKLLLHHSNHPRYVGVMLGHLNTPEMSGLVTQAVDLQLPHNSIHLAAQNVAGGYVPKVQIDQVVRKAKALKEKRAFEASLNQLRDFSPSQEMIQAVQYFTLCIVNVLSFPPESRD
jgi:hypothetical protein